MTTQEAFSSALNIMPFCGIARLNFLDIASVNCNLLKLSLLAIIRDLIFKFLKKIPQWNNSKLDSKLVSRYAQ